MGSITEPLASRYIEWGLESSLGHWIVIPRAVSTTISILLVTYVVVVLAELVPKYAALHQPERVAMRLVRPMSICVSVIKPLAWLTQKTGSLILRMIGIRTEDAKGAYFSKDELILLLQSGRSEGALADEHAIYVSRALRFDDLTASDIMIHRLDMRWIDVQTPIDQLLKIAGDVSHSRIPVCNSDIDEVVGILYLQDLARAWGKTGLTIEELLRPVVVIPENLSLDRIITRMRESKSQIVIVVDEYGGTSGLITLEDVSEEVFGDLEDQFESERPVLEWQGEHRISAKANVRYDELLDFMGLHLDEDTTTETLATLIVDSLGRVPRIGDTLDLPIGKMRVENMARRRITRVGIQLADHVAVQNNTF
jgi:CBS domain containing-hemolysin-like protein